jgi:tRNA threonylcarbamoyladenosine biosynthesis protein TsaE
VSHHEVVPPRAAEGKAALTERELTEWGERLGRQIVPPLVITLDGDLGAGKTTLTKAICAGYGVTEEVTSPTFALVHMYDAPKSAVYHVDLYRLEGPRDLQNIAWDDLVQADALLIIEWPERAGNLIPATHLPIQLRHVEGEPERRLLYAGGHVGHQTGSRSDRGAP